MVHRELILTGLFLLHACGAGLLLASAEPIDQTCDFGIEAAESVLVATRDLPKGTVVEEPGKYFVVHGVPAGVVTENAINEPESLKYEKLKKAVSKGEIITNAHLYTDEDHLQDHIPAGYIAIAILTVPECMMAGFI